MEDLRQEGQEKDYSGLALTGAIRKLKEKDREIEKLKDGVFDLHLALNKRKFISTECLAGAIIIINSKSFHTNTLNKKRLKKFVVELKAALKARLDEP